MTLKDRKDFKMVASITYPFIDQFPTGGSWRMTVDYCKLDQAVALIVGVVPDVMSLLEKMNKASDRWYMAIDLLNAFFSIPVRWEDQKVHIMDTQQCTMDINLPSEHNIVRKDLGHLDILSHWSTF